MSSAITICGEYFFDDSLSRSAEPRQGPGPRLGAGQGERAPAARERQDEHVDRQGSANTANSASDTDSVWVENLDIDGDGNVEQTSLLWDDEDRVLYMYSDDPFTCRNGGTGDGSMLVAVYGKGNTYKKPAGSGWYVAELDKSECAAQAAGIYGCKFDANGNATACGVAVVDDKNDDIVIATSTTPTLTMARPVRQGR